MGEESSLGPMRPIRVDQQPWMEFEDETGFVPEGGRVKLLIDPESGDTFMLGGMPPNWSGPEHWHPSDTIYIMTQGEMIVEGEATYRPGDVRWVRGGTAYGSETAGPEGCEFYIISVGPFDVKDPTKEAPPQGTWRDVLLARENNDDNGLDQMQPIRVDEQPWVDYGDETGFVPRVKLLIDPESGDTFMLGGMPPNWSGPEHWHASDTIYIMTQGEMIVEGEATYRPGDVRWVRGGTAYGSETAGPEGCEFYIISVGPFDVKDPTKEAPPRGPGT